MFQSTHPHGVRPDHLPIELIILLVSIHAPSRGATDSGVDANSKDRVSIHAPSRGATLAKLRQMLRVSMFQSTHPHGVRHRARIVWFIPFFVSIHAPSRGATLESDAELRDAYVSIHAPSRGATDKTNPNQKHLTVSIHAPSRGATLPSKQAIMLYGMFQSTHPHGVRRGCWSKKPIGSMFQSTHPHGVRL